MLIFFQRHYNLSVNRSIITVIAKYFYGNIPLVIDPNVVYSSANNMGINKRLKVLFLLLVIRFNATKLPLNSYIGWEKAIDLFSQY